MSRRLLTRSLKVLRRLRSAWSLALIRLQYGAPGFPADLDIASGVRLSVTDGGKAAFGRGCSIDRNATIIVKRGTLEIGEGGYVGAGAVIVARESIVLGRHILIAEHVTIRDQDHAFDRAPPTSQSGFLTAPVVIGDNVWLGAKVTVTRGVRIGSNTVVGANSVVTRDLPANVVAAGAPARVIRTLQVEAP